MILGLLAGLLVIQGIVVVALIASYFIYHGTGKANCLLYALWMWVNYGGRFIIRRSHLAKRYNITDKRNPLYWTPHFQHMSVSGEITQFTATDAQWASWEDGKYPVVRTWLRLWMFNGHILGDD